MMIDKRIQNLSNAIIVQAAKDYRAALRGKTVDEISPGVMVHECEKFFRSSWFMVLTDLDGEVLIEAIQNEVKHEKYRR